MDPAKPWHGFRQMEYGDSMNLNEEQKAAAFTESKNALVIAGAGSGKTRVLTSRVEFLIKEKKVSPYEIMCLTFTRAGAKEMVERLEKAIGNDAHKLHIGTIHALALNYIRRFGEVLGIHPASVTVYNEWESGFLLKEVARDLGVFNGKAWKIPKKEIDAVFNEYHSTGIEPKETSPVRTLFNAFLGRCRENNALTYGGLVQAFYLLLPEIKKRLHIRHVLVDEVQDIDRLQHLIISMAALNFGASVFMVGDVSQSIFEWRGAIPDYLISLEDFFDVYRLANNYRSKADIVEAANNLIKNNLLRIPLDMQPVRNGGQSIQVKKGCDSEQLIKALDVMTTNGGIQKKDITILARNHVLLKRLAQILTELNITHKYIGQKAGMVQSESFRRFIAFLKLILNPQDNFSFLLIKDTIGLGRSEYNQIRKEAIENGESHFQTWQESQSNCPVYDFFVNAICGKLSTLDEVLDALAVALLPNNFSQEIAFIKSAGINKIRPLLDWITTYDISDEATEDFEGLRLMTIHASKGLEFKTVMIAGCNEGLLPSKQAIEHGEIEAERRLMYVAMTRAMDNLILTVRPEIKETEFKIWESPVSRFLAEIRG